MHHRKDLIELYKITSNEHREIWTLRASKRMKKKKEKKSNFPKIELSVRTPQTKRKSVFKRSEGNRAKYS